MFDNNNLCHKLTRCVACDHDKLFPILDLGKQPLANSFKITKDDWQIEFPLAINGCEKCFHVQLTHAVNPNFMFRDYLYVSGTTKTGHQHFEDFATVVAEALYGRTQRWTGSVLDVGCNDGTQLDYFKKRGFATYGVDPAINLYNISSKEHSVFCGYFDKDFSNSRYETYDVITAQNVFAHTANPLEFLETAYNHMHSESILFIQTSQSDMIKNNEFDTIYHEHISFFNTKSMMALCKRAGLHLQDVRKMPIHGNSYVFQIGRRPPLSMKSIDEQIDRESTLGLFTHGKYLEYEKNVKHLIKNLVDTVNEYRRLEVGWTVVGYGAPAKGMTLLNYSGLKLDYVVDDNPLKQGRFTPGSEFPIYPSSKILETNDTILFVPLAWNFFDEIRSKVKSIRGEKGNYDRFVLYFPEVKVVE